MFRFNHPKEAAKLREKRKVRLVVSDRRSNSGVFSSEHVTVVSPQSGLLSSFSLSMTDLSQSCENLSTVMLYNPG